MGIMIDDQPDHEGSVRYVFGDGLSGSSYQEDFVFASYDAAGTFMPGDPDRRPDTEVIGWRAACDCGWTGPTWARTSTPADHNPTKHTLYSDDAMLNDADDDLVLADWQEHMGPGVRVAAIRTAHAEYQTARRHVEDAIIAARSATPPVSWEAIGRDDLPRGASRRSSGSRLLFLVCRIRFFAFASSAVSGVVIPGRSPRSI